MGHRLRKSAALAAGLVVSGVASGMALPRAASGESATSITWTCAMAEGPDRVFTIDGGTIEDGRIKDGICHDGLDDGVMQGRLCAIPGPSPRVIGIEPETRVIRVEEVETGRVTLGDCAPPSLGLRLRPGLPD